MENENEHDYPLPARAAQLRPRRHEVFRADVVRACQAGGCAEGWHGRVQLQEWIDGIGGIKRQGPHTSVGYRGVRALLLNKCKIL